jgi:hypothetical protein
MQSKDVLEAWPMMSSHGSTTYETVLYTDGSTSCDCPAWIYPKAGRPRTCKHLRALSSEIAQRLAEYRSPRPQALSPEAERLLRRGMFPEPTRETRPQIWRTEPPWEEGVAEDPAPEPPSQSSPEPEQPTDPEPEPYLSDTARRARLLRFD